MTATAHLQLTGAIMDALAADPEVFAQLQRGDRTPLPKGVANGGFVRLLSARGRTFDAEGVTTQWRTAVVIEMAARAAAGQDPYEAIDELLQSCYSRISASEPEAGAWQWAGEPEIQWRTDEADEDIGVAALVLPIQHLTGPRTLSPSA